MSHAILDEHSTVYLAVRAELSELLEVPEDELSPHDSLLDFGLDSLRIMMLVERWRARGVDVSFVTLAETPTLSDYAKLFG